MKKLFILAFFVVLSCGKNQEISMGVTGPEYGRHGLTFYFEVSNKFPITRVYIDNEIPEDGYDYSWVNGNESGRVDTIEKILISRGSYFEYPGYPERRGIMSNTNYFIVEENKILKIENNSTNLITNISLVDNEFIISVNKKYFITEKIADNSIFTISIISNLQNLLTITNFKINSKLCPLKTKYGYVNGDIILGNGNSDLVAYIERKDNDIIKLILITLTNLEKKEISIPEYILPIGIITFSPKNKYLFIATTDRDYKEKYLRMKKDYGLSLGHPLIYDVVNLSNIELINYNSYKEYIVLPEGIYSIDNELKHIYIYLRAEFSPCATPDFGNLKRRDIVGLWRMDISSLGLSE
ncbi:MAG: hypothetical protein ACP5Q5_02535 [Brevinematia bacterium]